MTDDYEVLLVDLDGTVIDYDATEGAALRDVHRRLYAEHVSLPEFTAAFVACNARLWEAYRRGEGDLDRLRIERFARLGLPVPSATAAAWYERHLGLRATVFGEVRGALATLGRLFRLMLVTDGIAHVQYAKLWQTRLTGVFEKVVISAETGFRKPRPELLWHALDIAGTPASRALVVGDSLESDGAGARAAGLDFCWVRRAPGTTAETKNSVPVHLEVPDLRALAALFTG